MSKLYYKKFDCKPAFSDHFFLSTPFKQDLSWNLAVSLPFIIKIIVKIPVEIANLGNAHFASKPAFRDHFFLSPPFKENLSWNHAVSLLTTIKIIVKILIEIAISHDTEFDSQSAVSNFFFLSWKFLRKIHLKRCLTKSLRPLPTDYYNFSSAPFRL